MAQATRIKDVCKNCIDVEKVVIDCLFEPELEHIQVLEKYLEEQQPDKKNTGVISKYNGNYHQDLIQLVS